MHLRLMALNNAVLNEKVRTFKEKKKSKKRKKLTNLSDQSESSRLALIYKLEQSPHHNDPI